MITQWGALADEITQNAAEVRRLGALMPAAAVWDAERRHRRHAPSIADLESFEALSRKRGGWLSNIENRYIKWARRRVKLTNLVQICVGLLLLGALITSLYFFNNALQAQRVATDAQARSAEDRAVAEAAALAARISERKAIGIYASTQVEKDPVIALKLALAAWPDDPAEMDEAPEVVYSAIGAASRKAWTRTVISGHDGPVTSVAFSRDGQRILTGSYDGTARIWDAATGAEIRRLEGHGDWLGSVAFSPDGQRILTGSLDDTAWIWDAASGAEIRRLEGHGGLVLSVAYSPDGQRILTGLSDGTARIWDAASGAEIRRLEGNGGLVFSVAFSPDGQRILTGSYGGTARIWDAAKGSCLYSIQLLPDSFVVRDSMGKILRHGPHIWRYAHGLKTENGTIRVVPPSMDTLTVLEVQTP